MDICGMGVDLHFDTKVNDVVSGTAALKRRYWPQTIYREVCNIRRTKSRNWNVSRLILWLSLPNPLKAGVKSRMKV